MIHKNKFYIKNLETIFFLGYEDFHEDFIKVNKSLKIKTIIVSSKKKFKNNHKILFYKKSKFDNKFKKFVVDNCKKNRTLFISFSARWIFKKKDINDLFHNDLINFHNSRLPADAGGGGFSWRIMRNDRISNCLVHLIDENIDTGPIIHQDTSVFPINCRIPIDFENYSKIKLIKFYKDLITDLKKGNEFKLINQSKTNRSYYPRINTDINGWINWDLNSNDLIYFINAFDDPYSGSSTYINNKQKVRIKQACLHGGELPNHPFMSGIIYRKTKKWIVVATSDKNSLIIEKVLDKRGKNIIDELKIGDRFYTTPNKKFVSRSLRIKYVLKN